MSELTYKRELKDVTRDIQIKTGQFLMDAIEIGRLLFEAKAMVEPGGWGKYVEEELPFSHSWANNYMRLYKELGGEQLSLFGNSQAIMNLTPTKALELLVLPEQEREEFMETHDVEAMSSRELKQAIKDLEEEKKAREDAEEIRRQLEKALDAAKEDIREAEDAEKAAAADAREMEAKLRQAEAARHDLEQELDGLKGKLQEARAKAQNAVDDLKKAQDNPQIPDAVMEQLRKEAEVAAAVKAGQEIQQKVEQTEEKLKAAQAAAAEAEAKLAAAQKEVKLSNPNVVIFKTIMGQIQDDFNRMNGVLLKAQQEDPAVAENLKKAFLGLLDKLREVI